MGLFSLQRERDILVTFENSAFGGRAYRGTSVEDVDP
jgi:hypothetical protein